MQKMFIRMYSASRTITKKPVEVIAYSIGNRGNGKVQHIGDSRSIDVIRRLQEQWDNRFKQFLIHKLIVNIQEWFNQTY